MATDEGATIHLGGHDVTPRGLHCSSSALFVHFRISGPDPDSWDPSDHVVIVRPGDDKKLRWLDGTSELDAPGSGFSVGRLDWPGGTDVRIIYFDRGVVIDEESLPVRPPSTDAAHEALFGLDAVLVSEDWLDGPVS